MNRTLKIFLFSLLIMLIGLGIWGLIKMLPQPLALKATETITAKLSLNKPKPYYIGDLLPVTLQVTYREGIKPQIPSLNKEQFDKLELTKPSKPSTIKKQGGYETTVTYQVTAWETGEFEIPGFKLPYQTKNNQPQNYQVPSLKIKISSLLPAGKSQAELLKLPLRKTKPPVELPPNYQYLWYLLLLGLILGLIWGIKYWSQQRPQTERVSTANTPELIEPAHLIALRRLEQLAAADYLKNGNYHAYYIELSECLRDYLSRRFRIPALEMTTEEFLAQTAQDTAFKSEHRAIFRHFFNVADLVKFAKQQPEVTEAEADLQTVRHFVDETQATPPEVIAEAG